MTDGVPREHQDAAEEIRSHLVALRGGAMFMSPDDAGVLIHWLDDGRSVASILRALERAADARRKSGARSPLTLRQARRHLDRPTRGALPVARDLPAEPAVEPARPLEPVAHALEAQAASHPRGLELKLLAARLYILSDADPEALLRAALGHVRAFFTEAWDDLGHEEQALRRGARRADLAAAHPDLPEDKLEALVEQAARDELRRDYPLLSAATLWGVLEP